MKLIILLTNFTKVQLFDNAWNCENVVLKSTNVLQLISLTGLSLSWCLYIMTTETDVDIKGWTLACAEICHTKILSWRQWLTTEYWEKGSASTGTFWVLLWSSYSEKRPARSGHRKDRITHWKVESTRYKVARVEPSRPGTRPGSNGVKVLKTSGYRSPTLVSC